MWGPASSNAVLNHTREQQNLVSRSWSWVAPVSPVRGSGWAWPQCRELGRWSWGRDSLEGGQLLGRFCRPAGFPPKSRKKATPAAFILWSSAVLHFWKLQTDLANMAAEEPPTRRIQVAEHPRWERGVAWDPWAGEVRTSLFAFGSFFWVIVFFSFFFFVVLSQKANRTLRIVDAARACVCCFTQRLLPFLAEGVSKNAQTYLELLVILPAKWYCFSKFPCSDSHFWVSASLTNPRISELSSRD